MQFSTIDTDPDTYTWQKDKNNNILRNDANLLYIKRL
jgi:hypothetical protein